LPANKQLIQAIKNIDGRLKIIETIGTVEKFTGPVRFTQ
jgi:hypothetical protein